MEDIDRIEVIRGPSNAAHGIGAFLATINFVTKHASQVRGVDVSGNAGTNGILDGTVRAGGGAGGFEYRMTAGHRADNGFPNLADSRTLDYVTGRADWQINRTDALMLQAGVTSGTNDVGFRGPDDPGRSVRTTTGYAQARWERSHDADNGLSIQFYYYRFNLADAFITDLAEFYGRIGLPRSLAELGLDTIEPETLRSIAENTAVAPKGAYLVVAYDAPALIAAMESTEERFRRIARSAEHV